MACLDFGAQVYGLKPNSIVSVLATIGGLVTALGMPLAGSIIDATDKRLGFGRAMAGVLVVSNAAMVFITPDTWLVMTLLQAVVATFSFSGLTLVRPRGLGLQRRQGKRGGGWLVAAVVLNPRHL